MEQWGDELANRHYLFGDDLRRSGMDWSSVSAHSHPAQKGAQMTQKIVVPEGMLKAARGAFIAGSYSESVEVAQAILEAALRWLSENPIQLSLQQEYDLAREFQLPTNNTAGIGNACEEWMRRAFLEPEEELPAELRGMFFSPDITSLASQYNALLERAYKLGLRNRKDQ